MVQSPWAPSVHNFDIVLLSSALDSDYLPHSMLRTGRTLSRAVPGARLVRKNLSTDLSNNKNDGGDGGASTSYGTKLIYFTAFVGIFNAAAATWVAYQMENEPQWEKLKQLKTEYPHTSDALAKYHGMLANAGLFKGANLNKAASAFEAPATKKLGGKQNSLVQDAENNAKNNKDSVGAKKDAAALKAEAAQAKAQADAAAAQQAADAVEAAMKAKADREAQEAARAEEEKLAKAAVEVRTV
jgi:hypothetical protein